MPQYPTGRTRTYIASGTFGGTSGAHGNFHTGGIVPDPRNWALAQIHIQTPLGYLDIQPYVLKAATSVKQPFNVGDGLAINDELFMFGNPMVVQGAVGLETGHYVVTNDHAVNWSQDMAGSYNFSVEAEEYFEPTIGPNYADYGLVGALIIDPPLNSFLRVGWRYKIGGAYAWTIVCGGVTISYSGSIVSNWPFLGWSCAYNVQADVIDRTTAANAFCGCRWVQGQTTEAFIPTAAEDTYTDAYGSVTINHATSNKISATAYPDNSIPEEGPALNQASASATITPPRCFQIDGITQREANNYGAAVTYSVEDYLGHVQSVVSDGAGAWQLVNGPTPGQENWQTSDGVKTSYFFTPTHSFGASKNNWKNLRMYVDHAWLLANGEDAYDWRVLMHGRAFKSFTLLQAASYALDDGTALSPASPRLGAWANVANTALSIVGGAIHIIVSGGVGQVRRTFNPLEYCASYRYLRVRVRSVGTATQPVSLYMRAQSGLVAAKQWDFTTGADGTFVNVDLDLCCPSNATVNTDNMDSRWESSPTIDNQLWGVTYVGDGPLAVNSRPEFQFINLANGSVYEIDSITLVRRDPSATPAGTSKVNCQAPFWSPGSSTPPYRRVILGETDEKQSLEEADFGGIWGPGMQLASLINNVANGGDADIVNRGWTATPYVSGFPDLLHTNDGLACWLWGQGAIYSPFINPFGAWTFGFDIDCTSVQDIYAQSLWDEIEWPPGDVGDPFSYVGGSLSGPLAIRVCKFLRGRAHGICFKGDGTPNNGVTVTVGDFSALTGDGSGVTDAIGAYHTGVPYARGNMDHTVNLSGTTFKILWSNGWWHSRKRHRNCFRGVASACDNALNPWNYEDKYGRLHRAGVQTGDVCYSRSDFTIPPFVFTVKATSTGDVTDPRMVMDSRDLVYLVYTRSGLGIYEKRSDDDGFTWNAETLLIAGGSRPTIAVRQSEDGEIVVAGFIVASGKISATIQRSGDVAASALFNFKDMGGTDLLFENDSFHISPAPDSADRWLLSCVIKTEAAISEWQSWDDCATWTRVA